MLIRTVIAITSCRLMAHRVISLRYELRSLSGHSEHSRACCWLAPGREWPNSDMVSC